MTRQDIDQGDPITAGELRALRAYLEAGSAKAAAHRLGVQEQTVKNHLANMRTKLGVHNTASCVFILRDRLAA